MEPYYFINITLSVAPAHPEQLRSALVFGGRNKAAATDQDAIGRRSFARVDGGAGSAVENLQDDRGTTVV